VAVLSWRFSLRSRIATLGLCAATLACVIALTGGATSRAAGGTGTVQTFTGTFSDGATYEIQLPAVQWNGTLVLYSHGYVTPGSANPAQDVGDPLTGSWLLGHGYALAGSSYATTGWAIQQAIPDQIDTLNTFDAMFGKPTRTIAWGHSLGGMVTAGLLQDDPHRFTAALPMCGVLAGGVGTWNQALDSEFAIQQLIDPSLQVVNIANPAANLGAAEGAVATAQQTAQGRARLALASALADLPGWFTPLSLEPAATDFAAQEANQFQWLTQVDAPFVFDFRAELEGRAGGNPSWNIGVNYFRQIRKSADYAEVKALYAAAGLSLNADLKTLNSAPRIGADPNAVRYLANNIVFNGRFDGRPVLTMHTTGDGLVVNQDEQAYRAAADRAGDQDLLHQIFVSRAGHCAFTPAETVTAFQLLINRINTGQWDADTAGLNASAAALGPQFNLFSSGARLVPTAPAFTDFTPTRFLRPFDLARRGRGNHGHRDHGRGDHRRGDRGHRGVHGTPARRGPGRGHGS
jgi:prolyl oligopeptidase family protein